MFIKKCKKGWLAINLVLVCDTIDNYSFNWGPFHWSLMGPIKLQFIDSSLNKDGHQGRQHIQMGFLE